MVWTQRTYPITVTRRDDGTFVATETNGRVDGTGDTPMAAIIDYARQCEEIARDSMEANA